MNHLLRLTANIYKKLTRKWKNAKILFDDIGE